MQRDEAIVLEDIEQVAVATAGAAEGHALIAPEDGAGEEGETENGAEGGEGEEGVGVGMAKHVRR